MKKNFLSINISFLLNKKIITTKDLLQITNHNSTGLVAMWKSGERTMRTDDVVKLANYLNCTVDDLINKDFRDIKWENISRDEFEKELSELSNKLETTKVVMTNMQVIWTSEIINELNQIKLTREKKDEIINFLSNMKGND